MLVLVDYCSFVSFLRSSLKKSPPKNSVAANKKTMEYSISMSNGSLHRQVSSYDHLLGMPHMIKNSRYMRKAKLPKSAAKTLALDFFEISSKAFRISFATMWTCTSRTTQIKSINIIKLVVNKDFLSSANEE